MPYGANHGDGSALFFTHAYADFGMRHQAIGFEHFLDFVFGLQLGKPGNMKAHGNQWDANRAGLADAQIAAQLRYIKDLHRDEIAGTKNVIGWRGYARRG